MNRSRALETVSKASGAKEAFSAQKLYRSLRACGTDKSLARRVIEVVKEEGHADMSTQELERLAADVLKGESRPIAARYLLKRALLELGPTGYPFERLVASLYEVRGHRAEVGVILQGKCVQHEIDVVVRHEGVQDLIECKFRSGPGSRCDVKIALYVYARCMDLRASDTTKFGKFLLVTNTKFTGDAIQYSECVGLDLLGWDYPKEAPLPALIEGAQLHPLTCLTTLTAKQKATLLARDVVLCRDLLEAPEHLDALLLGESERSEVEREISGLLGS